MKVTLAIFLFLITASVANAQITPTTVNSRTQIMNVTGVTAPFCYAVFLPETPEAQSYYDGMEQCVDDTYDGVVWNEWSVPSIVGDPSIDYPGDYNFLLVDDGGAECFNLTYEDCLNSASYQGTQFTIFFSLESESNNIWGSNNGFWGDDFTTDDVRNTLQASVQTTGFNIWPLFVFVGIAGAFAIAGLLVYQIRSSVSVNTSKNKDIINPNGEDFIYHDAKDLEFKREYGIDPPVKRKRGRPRKNPLDNPL